MNEKGIITLPAPSSELELKLRVNGVIVPMFGMFAISTQGSFVSERRYCCAEADVGIRATAATAVDITVCNEVMILTFPVEE